MSERLFIHPIPRKELESYVNEIENNTGLFMMIQESFRFDFKYYQGVDERDMTRIIESTSEEQLKKLLEETPLVGRGAQVHCDNNAVNGTSFSKSFFWFKRNKDSSYDIVFAHATQMKAVNWEKFGLGLGVAIVAGVVTSVLFTPAVGLAVGGSLSAASAGKTALDKQFKTMSNVIIGYIGKELHNRNLLLLPDQ